MKKQMSKAILMRNAWKLAKGKAKELGGKAIEYISYGMKEAWKIYFDFTGKKRASEKQSKNIDWSDVKLNGTMTAKQEGFIDSLLSKGKTTGEDIEKAFNVSSLRSRISKQQASDLITDLLAS